ncbi:MAG TPA: CHAT domain-containing protein [Thermoanaerobaculia bacterium]|nr:CHAT domain-containing protein [Thermoanaerobaculia bacterium]
MNETYLDSELYLPSLDRACFSWEGRSYEGAPVLGYERALEIGALEGEPEAYGRELLGAILPEGSDLYKGFREAALAAELAHSRLRFRLRLSVDLPAWVHALYWELLADSDPRRGTLARSPETAFSRYTALSRALGEPIAGRPRLLCVIAAPSDIGRFGMAEIDRREVLGRLQASLGDLSESVEVEILEPPATLSRLRERLMSRGGAHLLHFFGHGDSRGGGSALFLEDENGRTKPVPEEMLAKLFLGARELRLVTLVACHGGALSSSDPFSGLAGRLVQQGLPAVIAMRRAVTFETGHRFTAHFYRQLAETGRVDAAVNEARQQLYLSEPRGIAWSSPVLYSRLQDGRLWLPPGEEEPGTSVPLLRFRPRRLLRPLPWLPAALCLLLVGLGLRPAAEAEARFDLWASRLSFRLAESATVVERLALEELAGSQLAAVRLSSTLPAPSQWGSGGLSRRKGFFLLKASKPSAFVTLNAHPLPAGADVVLEHQGGQAYRLSFAGSDHELSATFQGNVTLKLPDSPSAELYLEYPKSLKLYPRSGIAELDLTFSRFATDAFSSEISIDRLTLVRIEEQHTPRATMVREESTLLGGEVLVPATGAKYRLSPGERLRSANLAGTLTSLRVGNDGIRFRFQGQVSKLELLAKGLKAQNLMPSVLDLGIPEPAQLPAQGTAGVLAAAVLLFTALEIRPRFPHRPQPSGAGSAPAPQIR